MAFENLSGRMPNGSAFPTRNGVRLQSRPDYRYPVRPDVAAGNARMKVANAVYWSMTQREVDAWTRWGIENPRTDPITGVVYSSDSRNAFCGLALKILQIDPDAELPRLPPSGRFVRQRLTLTVEPVGSHSLPLGRGRGGAESPEVGEATPTLPSPEGEGSPALRLTVSAPTRPGLLVEFKVQPLKHILCKPQKFYKSYGFVAFTADGLSVDLPLPPGAYAVAAQQVEPSTGLTAGFTPLGKFEIPG